MLLAIKKYHIAINFCPEIHSFGRVDRASATAMIDLGLTPSRVKPKTIKIGIHSFPA